MRGESHTIRRITWIYTLPHLLVMFGLIWIFWKVWFPGNFNNALLAGAVLYLAYSFGSKAILTGSHKRGIDLLNNRQFREAISSFHSSYSFLTRYEWLDRYRFITLLDSSAISYREMALCNIAYAYARLGERGKSREYYQKALIEFPGSDLAKNGLKFIDEDEGSEQTTNHII